MPRPPKRGAAATETIQVRVTPAERDLIDEHRGFQTMSGFLLDSAMNRIRQMNTPVHPDRIAREPAPHPDLIAQPTAHRHKRGTLASETTIKGVTIRSWNCAEPGCPEILGGTK